MPRASRKQQWTDEACYHVLDRGHNRDTVFTDDEDRAAFLGLVARYRQRLGFRLYHYCLLDNHFHLLLQLQQPRQLSALMAGLLRAYGHHCHRRHAFVGHLWQGRFKSPAVQRDGYLLSCGRYIERNPLEAGLVAEPWQYAWSNCRAYALGRAGPLLDENPCYAELAVEAAERQRRWRQCLLASDPREEAVRRGDWAIGDEPFRQRLQQLQGRPARRRRGRPRKAADPGVRAFSTQATVAEVIA
jgi:putative transposase